jgi:hypothetical protein
MPAFTGRPWVFDALGSSSDLDTAIESAEDDGGLVRLDARAMRTADELWDVYGRHFSFPTTVENWPAFHEYIRDLSWFQAFSYLTVIEHAGFVLADEPLERATFRRLLSSAGQAWENSPVKEFRFNSVFLFDVSPSTG